MPTQSLYFAKAPLVGPGKMHFLITPLLATPDSAPATLLGSLVNEIDAGLFGMKEIPGIEHAWKREYVLQSIGQAPALQNQTLVLSSSLAAVNQQLKVEKKFKLGVDAPIPGVPAAGSIGIDYSKVRSVNLELGRGCEKRYIPTGFLHEGYVFAQNHSNQFDPQLFYDDYMAVSQLLIIRELKLLVESETDFSAGFDAKADDITNLKIGVSYSKKTKRSYEIKVDDGNPYLFAIAAVQLDRIKG